MPPPPAAASPPPILLVGDVMLDRYFDGTVERISPEAPVPVLHVRRSFERPGGAANVAVNVAAMGGQPTLVGAVGTDEAGRRLAAVLDQDGVSAETLVATDTVPTTVKTRLLAGHNQIARFDEESILVDSEVHERVVERITAGLPKARVAVISDYAKGVCDQRVCRTVIEAARSRGIPVIVDPKGPDFTKYAGATVITPNRSEAMAVVGFPIRDPDDAIRAAATIRERHRIEAAVVTLGEQGMVVVTGTDSTVIPTQARQVYDVTGAGDSAVATLAVALGRGTSLPESCVLANAAAGLQVSRIGTARITWSEVMAAIDRHAATSRGKLLDRAELRSAVRAARSEGKRIGFTNGCFDILHHGHVALLEAAARECDLLIVGVNSDASVARLKGPPRPFVPSAERRAVLAGLASVAWVCEFSEDTPLELIRAVEPDVLVKGADYAAGDVVGADVVRARGGRVVTPLFVPDASTTTIVDRIRLARGSG
ncbi:MAG: D-glycero-beta-D-manno-heptose-7-phosphate kinase [Planctomycetia bacterium]|nr:D-glycero-beta-D-manno-heptose-7-phosphate kinase [Planctomycetia bacterium]